MNSCRITLTHLRQTLSALAIVGITFSACAFTAAQTDLSSPFGKPSVGSNIVSINQLRSPEKTLRTAARARQFLIDGHLEKAQTEIAKALRDSPDCATALVIQASIHLRSARLDDAATEFQQAIDADPTLGQAYVGLGILLIARRQFRKALVPLDRAESFMPASWLVHFESATANLLLGNIDAASKQIKVAQAFVGTDPAKMAGTAYMRALVSIHLHDYASATRYLEDVLKFNPAGPYANPARIEIEQMKPLLEPGKGSLAVNHPAP